ncbi:hypothetical protein ACLMJK_001085 [Lecanora helva]
MAQAVNYASGPKALIFDLMGTCCDWNSSILPALHSAPSTAALPSEVFPQLARDWREGFFKEAHNRYEARQPVEDIDITHRRVLNWLLLARKVTPAQWDENVRTMLVQAWHSQIPWPDVVDALERLGQKYIIKPDKAMYTKALDLIQVSPSEAMMVAAHAYDLRAAKKVGMRTAYVQRSTEDLHEDMKAVRGEVDFFFDGSTGTEEGGFADLAKVLGV